MSASIIQSVWNFAHSDAVIDGWSEIALRWMSLDLTDDKATFVGVMAWYRLATSHLPESMLTQIYVTMWCHYSTVS